MAGVVSTLARLAAQLGGLAILAGTLAAVVAVAYRWYVREEVSRSLALLVGLSGIAVYLNTTTALGQVIAGTAVAEVEIALFNIAAFVSGGGGAALGRRAGDRFASEIVLGSGDAVDEEVGRLVRTVGRVVTVTLPEEIDDVVGYDPVADATKEKLAGKTFVFPRNLTVQGLRERLVERITTDYAVGHVDIELAEDGTVTYLALGARAAGIGPTLPPATNAVAVRADPAFAASAGDIVQVWRTDPMERVLTAELRGVSGDVATLAIDAADTPKVDPTEQYRLVTLPVEDRPDREFASLLRGARETFSSVTVAAGSPLHGLPAGALTPSIVAVKPEDGDAVPIPDRTYLLRPGDELFAIATPEALRRLERGAAPLDPSLAPGRRATREEQAATPTAPDAGGSDASADDATAESGPAQSGEADGATAATSEAGSDADVPEAGDAGGSEHAGEPEPPGTQAATGGGTEGGEADENDDPLPGAQADSGSFRDLKEEFESGDADWAERGGDEGAETADGATGGGGDDAGEGADAGGEDDGDGVTFEDSLDGLSIGEGEESDADEPEFEDDDETEPAAGDPGLDGTDDLSFDEGSGSDAPGGEGGLDELEFEDDGGDDLLDLDDGEGLSVEEGSDSTGGEVEGSGEDDSEGDGDDGDDGNDGDDDEDDEDDESGGGGGKSFQELKEEFESGDADWEDEVSDSPGGDMALDPDE